MLQCHSSFICYAADSKSLAMPLIGLLIGIGAFVSGQVIRFRPKTIGGIIGAVIGILSFTLQGDLWTWQLFTLSLASVAAQLPNKNVSLHFSFN